MRLIHGGTWLALGLLVCCQEDQHKPTADAGDDSDRPDSSVDSGADADADTDSDTDSDSVAPVEPVVYTAVSTGKWFTCGLRGTGDIDCWGSGRVLTENVAIPPEGEFQSIKTEFWQACGVTSDGTAFCWGDNTEGQLDHPSGAWLQIVQGYGFGCGLRLDNTVECWGTHAPEETPVDRFEVISSIGRSLCGITLDGKVSCWGDPISAPESLFSFIDDAACGITLEQTVECWHPQWDPDPLPGLYEAISVGPSPFVCGLHLDGTIECHNPNNESAPPADRYKHINIGWDHPCGVSLEGEMGCWGHDAFGEATPTEGIPFRKIDSQGGSPYYLSWNSTYLGCALDSEGHPYIWGEAFHQETSEIMSYAGTFRDLCSGGEDVCGITDEGDLMCSGPGLGGVSVEGEFVAVDCAGYVTDLGDLNSRVCVLDSNGMLECYGPADGLPDLPTGPFISMAIDVHFGCAIREEGTLACWSVEGEPYPDGKFQKVVIGGAHTCGLHEDGTIECWASDNEFGQASPPQDVFVDLAAGTTHTCAISTDQAVVCWGSDYDGVMDAPQGEFVSLAAGVDYTCAIRADRSLACWGALNRGLNQDDFR